MKKIESFKAARDWSVGLCKWISENRLLFLTVFSLVGFVLTTIHYRSQEDGLLPAAYSLLGYPSAGEFVLSGTGQLSKGLFSDQIKPVFPTPFGNWLVGITFDRIRDPHVGKVIWKSVGICLILYFFSSTIILGTMKRLVVLSTHATVCPDFKNTLPKINLQHILLYSIVFLFFSPSILSNSYYMKTDLMILIFLFLFSSAFLEKNYPLSALFFGIASAIYPGSAVFGLMYLYREERKTNILAALGYFSALNVFALTQFEGPFFGNLSKFAIPLSSWLQEMFRLNNLTILLGFTLLGAISFVKIKNSWRQFAFLTSIILFFKRPEIDSNLIFLLLPIALLQFSENESDLGIALFSIVFGLLMTPRNYFAIPAYDWVFFVISSILVLVMIGMLFLIPEEKNPGF